MPSILSQLNGDLDTIIQAAKASLVQVHNGRMGHGAGVIWSTDGLILTNGHVARRRKLHITLPGGQTLPATFLGRLADHDLAALKVDASDLKAISRGDSQSLKPGQWALAIGHPWGVKGASTAGSVIGVGANLPENPMRGREWVAVSLHYRPGHSGGPLLDAAGRMIGTNTIMTGPDVGLAVPVHVAERFMSAVSKLPAPTGHQPVRV